MKKTLFPVVMVLCLVFLSGCRWFADNPMFPTAKLRIEMEILDESGSSISTGSVGIISRTSIESQSATSSSFIQSSSQETTTSTQEGTTEESSESQSATYTDTSSVTQEVSVIFARSVQFTFYPLNKVGAEITRCLVYYYDAQGNHIPSLERYFFVYILVPPLEDEGSEGVSWTVEIFSNEVQDYFSSHGITVGQALLVFEGEDSAGHAVSYRTSVNISAAVPDTEVAVPEVSSSPSCQSCQ